MSSQIKLKHLNSNRFYKIKYQIFTFLIFIQNIKSNNCLKSLYSIAMSQPLGLVFCVKDWSDTFCITKSIQFLVSLVILLILLHDFFIRSCKERQLNFFFVVCLQMIVALIANCLFFLDHSIRPIQHVQSCAYNIYFTTIVYQVARRLVQLKKGSPNFKWIWYTIHGLLIFFIVFLIVTFIVRSVIQNSDCDEVWFIVVNLFGIVLSILMVIAGRVYTKFQQEKIQGMIEKNTKNPLPLVWKWIIINIVCQFFRFLRSFIYVLVPYNCQFSNSYQVNEIVGLFFDVFSFHVGMVATIIFFRRRVNQDDISSKQFDSSIRDRIGTGHSKQIQMQSTIQKSKRNELGFDNQQELRSNRYTSKKFIDASGTDHQKPTLTTSKMPFFSI